MREILSSILCRSIIAALMLLLIPRGPAAIAAPSNPCVRYAPGSVVQDPENLSSQNGTLTVNLAYNTGVDANGLTLYCFTATDGSESPTLHVNPGDTLVVNVTNNLPAPAPSNDMQLRYDGKVQPLQLVSLDGVPIGSQDGMRTGRLQKRGHIFLPPAARAEFIVTGPSAKVKKAISYTLKVITGPDGDNDPTRPLAQINLLSTTTIASSATPSHRVTIPQVSGAPGPQRFEGLATAKVTAKRTLYFSETSPPDDEEPNFFITVAGAPPNAFNPDNPPAITTTQGSVEDWTIQNRSGEAHEFHIHQIHFLTLARNGQPLPASQQQYVDMVHVPFWPGHGPFPSVTVRMDFRGQDIGDFVYHCHILEHEDHGMMAIIRVNPATASTSRAKPAKAAARSVAQPTRGGMKLIRLTK